MRVTCRSVLLSFEWQLDKAIGWKRDLCSSSIASLLFAQHNRKWRCAIIWITMGSKSAAKCSLRELTSQTHLHIKASLLCKLNVYFFQLNNCLENFIILHRFYIISMPLQKSIFRPITSYNLGYKAALILPAGCLWIMKRLSTRRSTHTSLCGCEMSLRRRVFRLR